MITVHVISSAFPPQSGGLEQWTEDFLIALSHAGFRPILYLCGQRPQKVLRHEYPFDIVDIDALRTIWEVPLIESDHEAMLLEQERLRLSVNCIEAEIARRRTASPDVIVSNFMTTVGFTAHLVAESLDIAHIPAMVGTDFSRGFRTSIGRQIIGEICRTATCLVCKNQQQALAIRKRFPRTRVEIIETSVTMPSQRWIQPHNEKLVIFSDVGYSYKKGTAVLIEAFTSLVATGFSAELRLCGSDQPGQDRYWSTFREEKQRSLGSAVSFLGYLSHNNVVTNILHSNLYASATLGEGSSAARALALCLGVPMLTTSCGELFPDPRAGHVRLVSVADAQAFVDELAIMLDDIAKDRVLIDNVAVEDFRRRFAQQTEWTKWLRLLQEATV